MFKFSCLKNKKFSTNIILSHFFKNNIVIENNINAEATVVVYNIGGKEMLSRQHKFDGSPYRFELNGLPQGVYILKVFTDKAVSTERVVISN